MKKILLYIVLSVSFMTSYATALKLIVNAEKAGAEIAPTLYGLFFEDINFAADGGLYAEKIKNRSFEFPQNLMGWKIFGNVEVKEDGPFERNPMYVRLTSSGHPVKFTGLENEGFSGIGVEKDEKYIFSFWARVADGNEAQLEVVIADKNTHDNSQQVAVSRITVNSNEWQKYETELQPWHTVKNGVLRLFLCHPDNNVVVDLEHLSLFPAATWKNHKNGLRKDIAQKIADLRPGVFRFPGGCIVEGADIGSRYQWKNTVGPVENRPTIENRWHYTFTDHFFPDYFQSNGLGFYEYFLFAEEIGAEPVPVVNVGMACQFQNSSPDAHVDVDSLECFIQDALDLIEFANGDSDTPWGKVRTEMGHQAPFNLKYLALGNEQWGKEYVVRLEKFIDPIRQKYPDIKIIGSSGPDSEGEEFDFLWSEMKRLNVDLVDEHYYRNEDWFFNSADRYDSYDRNSPKVFAGEYACHIQDKKWNQFEAALMEAAFMTGLERNADIVSMSSYAPLLAHEDSWQWRPDMIWFDNLNSVATTSYYVQKMFSSLVGTRVLSVTYADGSPVTGKNEVDGIYASASIDKNDNKIFIKIVNTSDESHEINLDITGLDKNLSIPGGSVISLHGNPEDENTLREPDKIIPEEHKLTVTDNRFKTILGKKTFAVFCLDLSESD